jgi:hypothetical protein
VSLAVVLGILAVGIVASIIRNRRDAPVPPKANLAVRTERS